MSEKSHSKPSLYLYEYLRLGVTKLDKNPGTEVAQVWFDLQTGTQSDTIAVSVGDGTSMSYPWKHLLHTIEPGENVSITRDPVSGVATISCALDGSSGTSVANAACSSGIITESKLNNNGKCWLNTTVNAQEDYWDIHVYRGLDGVEIHPEIGIQNPSMSASHFYIDFGSVENFKSLSGMVSNHYVYVKFMKVTTDVGTIGISENPYAEIED